MVEYSMPWENNGVGDGQSYSSNDWAYIWESMFLEDLTEYGVFRSPLGGPGANNELTAAEVAANTVRIYDGIAMVRGKMYVNFDTEDFTVPNSVHAAGRHDRIVLRCVWLGGGAGQQTVRLEQLTGVEGGGSPALTQNYGIVWEIPLWDAHITIGGVITLTDERSFVVLSRSMPLVDGITIDYTVADELEVIDGGITYAKLAAAVQALLINRANYELTDSVTTSVSWTLPSNVNWNDIDSMVLNITTTVVCDLICLLTCTIDDQQTATGQSCLFRFDMDGATQSESQQHDGGEDAYHIFTIHAVWEDLAAGAHVIKAQYQRTDFSKTAHMLARRLTVIVQPRALT